MTSVGDNHHPNADRESLIEGLCPSMGSPVDPAAVEHWYAELEGISTIWRNAPSWREPNIFIKDFYDYR